MKSSREENKDDILQSGFVVKTTEIFSKTIE